MLLLRKCQLKHIYLGHILLWCQCQDLLKITCFTYLQLLLCRCSTGAESHLLLIHVTTTQQLNSTLPHFHESIVHLSKPLLERFGKTPTFPLSLNCQILYQISKNSILDKQRIPSTKYWKCKKNHFWISQKLCSPATNSIVLLGIKTKFFITLVLQLVTK